MSFNLTTFILEIINFLVLLWILQKLFYKPVLAIVSARQSAIDGQIKEADDRLKEAHGLKEHYEKQIQDWEKEKSSLLSQFRAEIQTERENRLDEIRREVSNERKRVDAVIDKLREDEARKYEEAALDLAGQFTAKVLTQLASPELERRICKIFIQDLKSRSQTTTLNELDSSLEAKGEVQTAYPLNPDDRREIERALKEISSATLSFATDENLIAGIKVTIAGTVLESNLKDAVSFFQGLDRDASR